MYNFLVTTHSFGIHFTFYVCAQHAVCQVIIPKVVLNHAFPAHKDFTRLSQARTRAVSAPQNGRRLWMKAQPVLQNVWMEVGETEKYV